MNSSANQSINRQHSFNSPVLQATSGKYLIYNWGGNGFKIEGTRIPSILVIPVTILSQAIFREADDMHW